MDCQSHLVNVMFPQDEHVSQHFIHSSAEGFHIGLFVDVLDLGLVFRYKLLNLLPVELVVQPFHLLDRASEGFHIEEGDLKQ